MAPAAPEPRGRARALHQRPRVNARPRRGARGSDDRRRAPAPAPAAPQRGGERLHQHRPAPPTPLTPPTPPSAGFSETGDEPEPPPPPPPAPAPRRRATAPAAVAPTRRRSCASSRAGRGSSAAGRPRPRPFGVRRPPSPILSRHRKPCPRTRTPDWTRTSRGRPCGPRRRLAAAGRAAAGPGDLS